MIAAVRIDVSDLAQQPPTQVFPMSAQPEISSSDPLEAFRRDTREWLEANCPAEMRQPVVDESDVCWGGRQLEIQERRAARCGWRKWRSAAGPCRNGRRRTAAAA